MTDLTIFNNVEFGSVRTAIINGEPYFVGRDVAEILGYAKTENAIASHVYEGDKTTTLIQGTGSNYKSKAYTISDSASGGTHPSRATDALEAEAHLNGTRVELSNLLLRIMEATDNKSYKEILMCKAANVAAGELLLPLPKAKKSYSATEVGTMLGVSANMVGKTANKIGIKASDGAENEYGYWAKDTAKYSAGKEVNTWRYYNVGTEAIRLELIKSGRILKDSVR